MSLPRALAPRRPRRVALFACALLVLLGVSGARRSGKVDILRIGASHSPTDEESKRKGKAAANTLQKFIKDETGLRNRIGHEKNWSELADKLVKGQLHLGVFEGYEFGWAQEKHPGLRPLAIAVSRTRYPVACVVVEREHRARDFGGLQGQSLSLPVAGPYHLRLFVERQAEARAKKGEAFFSRITVQKNVEDALDDVIDGTMQAAVVDRSALEAYKRRKPGRASRLREVAHSQPFPPPVVAYYGTFLDETSRRRFLEGPQGASRKERGRMMLTFFKVTGFEAVPADFGSVVAQTRKAYPAPVLRAK